MSEAPRRAEASPGSSRRGRLWLLPGSGRTGGEGEAAAPERSRARRFGTRRRLFLAFSALAAVFAAAFGSELVGLQRIERRLEFLRAHEEQMRLALDLEEAIHSQFAHQAHFIVGEDAHLAGYLDASRRTAALVTQLSALVDEPEAVEWLTVIQKASRELDRAFHEEIAPAVLAREPAAMVAHDRGYRLVFEVEQSADRLFAFLRGRVAEQSRAIDGMHRETLLLAIVFLVGTPLCALALAVYLSRSIAQPLAVLGAGAARIAGGDLGTRIDIRSPDEFGTLAAEFNAMAAALAHNQERLVRSEKLAGLGRLAAGVAHEMNNPLQVMLGYLSLDRDRVEGELGQHLQAIEREATRCKEIVEGLLQLSRPAVPFVPAPVDLREVSEEVADAIKMSVGAAAPEITVEGQGTALGTRCRFRQIVFNLAKNAVEAAGRGGAVRIEVRRAETTVDVSVSDTGPGIPPDTRDRIFEPFFTTKSGGTGLGLAISRAIAGSLGGDLELEASDGGGARFTLRVPHAA